jgi:choice-of-anchor A domain-containing protein/RHS repeat-associated protein
VGPISRRGSVASSSYVRNLGAAEARVLALIVALIVSILSSPTAFSAEKAKETRIGSGSRASVVQATAASCTTLGQAQPYNAWTAENFTAQTSIVQGRIAVGGDLSLDQYSLGEGLEAATADVSVLVGGDFTFPSGRINHGDTLVGGSAAGVGAAVRNALSADQSITDHAQLPIDFEAAHGELLALSQRLAGLPANGTYRSQWGAVYLEGAPEASLQVFELPAQLVLDAHTLELTGIPDGDTVIVNLRGASAGLTDMGLVVPASSRRKLLFNFPDATALTLSGVSVPGSILAPRADIENPRGEIQGTVIARSWTGPMSLVHAPFEGCLPATPESNAAPTADSQQVQTREDEPRAISLSGSDPDGDALNFIVLTSPAHGLLSGTAPNFLYTPNADFSGSDLLTFVVSDGQLQSAIATVTITVLPADDSLPPPPEDVAPELPDGGAATSGTAAEFLIQGPDPIQVGADAGAYEPARTAVVRGRVLQRDGTPLAGVRVFVPGHDEYGYTLSRQDGQYDLLVNGGAELLLEFRKAGYLFAQRQAEVPWRDFRVVDDVVLAALDPTVVRIEANSATPQLAIGSQVEDATGPRRPAMYFPPGTQAEMILADGSTRPLDHLDLRMTEYTVGPNGPKTMPSPLPPTTAYTYAVELSVDQALQEGAKIDGRDVLFDRPVSFYVDNFMGFPAGELVPTGYYDNTAGEWKAIDDGRILRVLSIVDGRAVLDAEGQGSPASAALLTALGIDDHERAAIAQRFVVGDTFWRVQLPHLSTWDCNWPFGPPFDTIQHEVSWRVDTVAPKAECPMPGCEIGANSRNLGETLPLPGVPGALRYDSSRLVADAGQAGPGINLKLTPADVPASMKRVELELHFLGRIVRRSLPAVGNLRTRVMLSLLDPYFRKREGSYPFKIRVGYVYQPLLRGASGISSGGGGGGGGGGSRSFGSAGMLPITGDLERTEITEWWEDNSSITYQSAQTQRHTAGWQLQFQHVLDVASGTLMMGNGRTVAALDRPELLETVAGSDRSGSGLEGGPAIGLTLNAPSAVAVDARGRIYVADTANHRIRRIEADGTLTSIAGTGSPGYGGDHGPATAAQLNNPTALSFDADGRLYLADRGNHRIRRIETDGRIVTVAGTGTPGLATSGQLASGAPLSSPSGVAANRFGYVFIADTGNHRVWSIQPDGALVLVAGGGNGSSSDRGIEIALHDPTQLAADALGNVYVAESGAKHVRLVGADGSTRVVAGGGNDPRANNQPATQASLDPSGIAIDGNQRLLIADGQFHRIRRVDGNGVIATLAGTGETGYAANGLPARTVPTHMPRGIGVDPQGRVLFTHYHAVRRIGQEAAPTASAGEIRVADPSGETLHVFDTQGRHLRTLDALTGGTLYALEYRDGNIVAWVDAFGNRTRIERDATDQFVGLTSPDGLHTAFTLDGSGYLASLTTPEGHRREFRYNANGSLEWMRDARQHEWDYGYDADGRLIRDDRPDGSGWTLVARDLGNGSETDFISRLDRTTTHGIVDRPDGTQVRYTRAPDGTETHTTLTPDGAHIRLTPDGTESRFEQLPHPRFGTQAMLPSYGVVKTPLGLQAEVQRSYQATPTGVIDPVDLHTWAETTSINGRDFVTVFDKASLIFTRTTPEGRTSTVQVNPQRQPQHVQVPGLADLSYKYDSRGRIESISQSDGTQTREYRFRYDSHGYLQSVTDPLERQMLITNDSDGRPIKMTLPDRHEITLEPDPNGNITALTTPKQQIHRFGYDELDRETRYEAPAFDATGTVTTTDFDVDGNPDKQMLPGNVELDFNYDAAGRLINVSRPEQDGDAGNEVELSYGYDGPLVTRETLTGAVEGEVRYGYDNNFRLETLTMPGAITAYGYDDDGLLNHAALETDTTVELRLIRNPDNALLQGTQVGNVTDAWTWNAFGEARVYEAKFGNAALYKSEFERDLLGRITKKTETVQGITTVYEYHYDLAGRLDEAKVNGFIWESYTYDDNGNRKTLTRGGVTTEYVVDAQDRLLTQGGCEYAFTPNGELRVKVCDGQTTRYTYNLKGNLSSVELPDETRIEYLVDGKGRRVGRRINGQLDQGFLYLDQLEPIAELDSTGGVRALFVYADRGHVPTLMQKGGKIYRIVSDYLGSVRLVIDLSTGEVAQQLNYDAWGNITLDTRPGFQPFGYAGGIYDQNSGLHRFGSRDYDSTIGRWTTKDPIGFKGRQLSFYSYVDSNPISFIDPSGLATLCEAMANVLATDTRFVDGSWFDPLKVATEYVPPGGHGPANASFTHSDGRDYDIQYVQIGWSSANTYGPIGAHGLYFAYMMFVAAAQDDEYFVPENVLPNARGYQFGIDGAATFNSFRELVASQCGCEK